MVFLSDSGLERQNSYGRLIDIQSQDGYSSIGVAPNVVRKKDRIMINVKRCCCNFTLDGLGLWQESMVSIRRQRLIKLYGRSPPLDFISSFENGQSSSGIQTTRHIIVLPTPSLAINHQSAEDKTKSEEPESSNVNESSSPNKQPIQHPVFKRRKRHRRKHFENQEPCIMRGVYYKNMKWQAAIKVDKKQIHLGTVGSQEEAARLYDRAAFMCGREPNFELTDEQKEELSKLSWDDFLTMTRSAINSKKHQRRISSRMKFEHPSQENSDIKAEVDVDQGGNSLSGSETSGS